MSSPEECFGKWLTDEGEKIPCTEPVTDLIILTSEDVDPEGLTSGDLIELMVGTIWACADHSDQAGAAGLIDYTYQPAEGDEPLRVDDAPADVAIHVARQRTEEELDAAIDAMRLVQTTANKVEISKWCRNHGEHPQSQIRCLFCGRREISLSDRYAWGPWDRATVKAKLKRLAYRDCENIFAESFAESCVLMLELIQKHYAHDPEEFDLDAILFHIECMEQWLLDSHERRRARWAEEDEDYDPEQDKHPVRICPMCYDRGLAARNGFEVHKLFK